MNHRVIRFNATGPAGQSGTVVAGGNGQGSAMDQLNAPVSVWVTPSGAMLVADADNHRVLLLRRGSAQGIVLFGGNGAGSAMNQLSAPHDVLVVDTNLVYVAELLGHRVVARRCPELLS
eukprot:TRINITY_DN10287_c0_g1_i1.p3 TRINITY_DN10287_c0_g1~~TRINITY_DN10287_c0_g1_i1.p3  ORF type:complete len:119 (+),score=13.41 TRINITY_DN10287_c0_g1_i1:3-359(+)